MVWNPLTSYRQTLWANTQQTPTPTEPNQCATTLKNEDNIEISVACWKNREDKLKTIKLVPGNENGGANNSNPNNNINNKKNNNHKKNGAQRKPKTVYLPCETCGKIYHSEEKCYFAANAVNTTASPAQKTGSKGAGPRKIHSKWFE